MTVSVDVTPVSIEAVMFDSPFAVYAPDRGEPAPGLDHRDLAEGHLPPTGVRIRMFSRSPSQRRSSRGCA